MAGAIADLGLCEESPPTDTYHLDVKPTPLSTPTNQSPLQQPQVKGPQARFLLVEDNPINMRILQTYVKRLGQVYDSASDGLQALEIYKSRGGEYRCVFMDLSMPVMDGFESTRLIRAFEEEKGLPRCHILAISGLASKDAQQDAFSVGLDLFLSKPVQLKELSRILKSQGIFNGL